MVEKEKGIFIVIDGVDGAGKGTQIELLKHALQGEPVVFTREPGGTPYAEDIRAVIFNPNAEDASPLVRLLLFFAAREEHLKRRIVPEITRGTHVVSDRFDSSTFALQLYGEEAQEFLDLFFELKRRIVSIEPHYIILDMPPEIAAKRLRRDTARSKNYIDTWSLAYHARVREGFRAFAARASCTFIDADRSPREVHKDVLRAVHDILHKKSAHTTV